MIESLDCFFHLNEIEGGGGFQKHNIEFVTVQITFPDLNSLRRLLVSLSLEIRLREKVARRRIQILEVSPPVAQKVYYHVVNP